MLVEQIFYVLYSHAIPLLGNFNYFFLSLNYQMDSSLLL